MLLRSCGVLLAYSATFAQCFLHLPPRSPVDSNSLKADIERNVQVSRITPPLVTQEQRQYKEAPTWHALAKQRLEVFKRFSAQAIPQKDYPVPYVKEPVRACLKAMKCDSTREGVGRRGIIWQWALAISILLLTVFLHVIATSCVFRTSLNSGKVERNTKAAFTLMVASMMFSMSVGYNSYLVIDSSSLDCFLVGISLLLMTLCNIAVFGFVSVEFKLPDFSSSAFLQCMNLLLVLYCVLARTAIWFTRIFFIGSHLGLNLYYHMLYFVYFMLGGMLPPNLAMLIWLLAPTRMYAYAFYMWDDTTGVAIEGHHAIYFPTVFLVNVFSLLCFFTPYSRDRLFVAALGYCLAQALRLGQVLTSPANLVEEEFDQILMLALFAGLCCIFMRYQIVLPRQLQKVKYLRLDYLYRMRDKGQMIARCQDIPESAFGNPAKARRLIVISHRWLDRYMCDVATPNCPQGLRLVTMCNRFEKFFPWTWPGFSNFMSTPIGTLLAAMKNARYSTHDVLIFFDFMSLPQIGRSPDGTIIERTPEEQQLFKYVLPAMGNLYTMFPVMVCPDVTDGSTPYFQSGWCFCEWEQATVHDKLSQYSLDIQSARIKRLSTSAGIDEHAVGLSLSESDDCMEKLLQHKTFFFDSDRDIVRSIVRGTKIRKKLLDSVLEQDIEEVKTNLDLLRGHGLAETIDFAVCHKTMDTLLHVARKIHSEEIAAALIDFGADALHPNQRGEAPGEFFIFPRSWIFLRIPCRSVEC